MVSSALLEDKKREKEAIELYLKHCVANDGLAEKLLSNKEYQNLLSNYFRPVDSSLSEWMQASYETNNKYPEQKILKSCSGNMVRSKSEMMIDSSLYILYCILILRSGTRKQESIFIGSILV